MRPVAITALASYLPEATMDAAAIGAAAGIDPEVIVGRFGLRCKHVAGAGEHVSDMAVAAGRRALEERGAAPESIDAVVYFGSTWKDHAVWQVAPDVAHRLGCDRAFALELDYTSCGAPVAMRVVRDLLRAEPGLRRVLAVAASRESHLLDYGRRRSRFMLNFGDGAVAAVIEAEPAAGNRGPGGLTAVIEGCAMRTDGALARHVKVPAGGSVLPASERSVRDGGHLIDVEDLDGMKAALDGASLDRFVAVAEEALAASGALLADVDRVCAIHMKRSMHRAVVAALGVPLARAAYLEDTGHMSGVDPLLALDRDVRAGRVTSGDLVLLLAAGTGYTWAATTIRIA